MQDHTRFESSAHLDEADDELCVEHEDGFVVPWVLTVQVDAVKDVLDQSVGDDREQDGVLEAEHELKQKIIQL